MKITLIGGGSWAWGPKLINDFCLTEELDSVTICLHDMVRENAELVQRVGRRMADTFGKRFNFEIVDDLADAVRDAFVVSITITTGGLSAMEHDLKISEKYGVFHTVGDTVGPGGWARALRNIPVFQKIGAALRDHAPNAWVFNFSNPMAVLTGTLSRYVPGKVTGCCHGPWESRQDMKAYLGLSEDSQILCETSGVNHFFWVTKLRVDGKDILPELTQRRDDPDQPTFMEDKSKLFVELWRMYGRMPYNADRHTCEFLPWAIAPSEDRLKLWDLKRTFIEDRHEWARESREWIDTFLAGEEKPKEEKSGEAISNAIPALAGKYELVDVLNVTNRGQCPQLPADALVETSGVINSIGFTPLNVSPLPGPIATLIRVHAQNQLDLLDAVEEWDWNGCVRVLRNDPLCSHLPPDKVRELANEFRAVNQEWLKKT